MDVNKTTTKLTKINELYRATFRREHAVFICTCFSVAIIKNPAFLP